MAYSDFDKLKAFFFELKKAKFHPEKMRSRFVMNGGWATVNKAECFDLLRKKIPDLQGKDDAFLVKYLSNPNNIKNRVLAGFVAGERIELEKSLAEPTTADVVSGQAISAEQTTPVGTTTSTSAGGMSFKMPSAPSIPSVPRFPRVIVRDKDIPQVTKEETINQPSSPQSELPITNTPSIAYVSARTPAETKQVESTVTSPSSRRFNFPSFRSSLSSGFKKMQNLASPAGPFLKVNSGRIGNGLKNMFGRTANFGGRAGLGAINHGGNFLSNLSNARSRFSAGASSLSPKNLGSKRALLIFGGIFFLIFFVGALGGMGGTTSTGEAAPIPPSGGTQPPSPTIATDCPIPNGSQKILCGSQATPLIDYSTGALCGHCGIGYPDESIRLYCGYTGTKYAIDVAGNNLDPIYLPKIDNNIVNWSYVGEDKQSIQMYTGSVTIGSVRQTYFLQLHHTQQGSGNASARQSGDVGGKIGTGQGHVHIQIGSGGNNPGDTSWTDAAQYFCR